MDDSKLDSLYYEQIARIGKAMASPSRLRLLEALSYQPHSVEELANETDLSVANTSQHLQKLKDVRLVETNKKGTQVYYRLASTEVSRFYQELQKMAEQHLFEIKSIVDQFHTNAEELEKVDIDALAQRARKGEAIVLDARPREEYEQEHFPGAVSVPLEEIENQLDSLPEDKEIFAYCRGSYCILSDKAVQKLRREGYQAHRLPEGIDEWKNKNIKLTGG